MLYLSQLQNMRRKIFEPLKPSRRAQHKDAEKIEGTLEEVCWLDR